MVCAGVQVHVTDRDDFDAIRTAIAMIVTAARLYPDEFAWRETAPPYWIDKLTGLDQVRLVIDAGADVDEVVAAWRDELAEFRRTGPGTCSTRTPVVRRLAVIVLAFAVALLGRPRRQRGRWPTGAARASTGGQAGQAGAASYDVTPDDLRFQHHRLRDGTPEQAQRWPRRWTQWRPTCGRSWRRRPTRPLYAGAVVLASRHGVVPVHEAPARRCGTPTRTTELPADQQVPMRRDTIFDLASVSKLFTSIAVMQQVEAGRVDLDEPVATYLPEFAANGKDDVTVRQLLTHTSGLPAWMPLCSAYPTVEDRLAAVLAVEPDAEPGEAYVYCDLNLITLGLLVEQVTGKPLDQVVADGITGPLRMTDTGFNPPAAAGDRIAATESQPGRAAMVRGEVHDENAWSLGGVAGHAGLFSTAHDLAMLAQTMLNGGRYGHAGSSRPTPSRR